MPDTQTVEVTRHAEGGLLGSIMLAACFLEGGIQEHKDALRNSCALVKPEHFAHSAHARYYKAMQECEQPDLVGTLLQLSKNGQLKRFDRDFLTKLCNDTPTSFDLMHYAEVVVQLWEERTGKSRRNRGISV